MLQSMAWHCRMLHLDNIFFYSIMFSLNWLYQNLRQYSEILTKERRSYINIANLRKCLCLFSRGIRKTRDLFIMYTYCYRKIV